VTNGIASLGVQKAEIHLPGMDEVHLRFENSNSDVDGELVVNESRNRLI
jgi:hypothetical protein